MHTWKLKSGYYKYWDLYDLNQMDSADYNALQKYQTFWIFSYFFCIKTTKFNVFYGDFGVITLARCCIYEIYNILTKQKCFVSQNLSSCLAWLK